MKLLTAKIINKACKQYQMGAELEGQTIVAKFFDPCGSWVWYLMNLDDDLDYAWGIVNGLALEMGSFSINELQGIERPFGLGIERDRYFKPIPAKECWDRLSNGKHI